MKLSCSRMTILLSASLVAFATTALASVSASGDPRSLMNRQVRRSLLQNARRLADDDDDDGGNGGNDDRYNAEGVAEVEDELMNYSLKLLKCEGEETFGSDNDDGVTQYGIAIVRACPTDSCSDNTQGGCTSGHADFAVPLMDFIAAYMEDQADNMQWDDASDVNNFAQCAQYEQEAYDDDQRYQTDYYIGPACTNDGLDIKLDVFSDAYCSKKADVDFEDISNGWELPFSDGGLVSDQCLTCGEDADGDDDNSQLQLKEMCADFYEDATLKCEEWDIAHYYWDAITEVYRFGKDTTGCKRIGWMDKSPEPFSEWASIFALSFLVVGSIAGAVWYTMWWKQRKFRRNTVI